MTTDLQAMYEEFFTGKKPEDPIDEFIRVVRSEIDAARPSLEMRTEKLENGSVLIGVQEYQENGKLFRINRIFTRNAIISGIGFPRVTALRMVREFEIGIEIEAKSTAARRNQTDGGK